MDKPISTPFELFEEIRRLIQRGELGGVDRRYLDPLFSAGEAIMACLSKQRREEISGPGLPDEEERRAQFRIPTNTMAEAVVKEERFPVEVIDLGARGFGLLSVRPLTAGDFLRLEVQGREGVETFSCFVAFVREKEGVYRAGLRLFARLPRGRG